ncbi:kinase-like domain-containing protein, partial [Panaeolus papilionaceus]
MATNVPFLDQYEPLDVIGNGSFGIIRKVKRKSDGTILARKELNFERMSERDRKQIVAEVNILKELNHVHIVRYYDRYVDRDAGFLYILMEYCGGGDLSTVIKTATKQGRLIPEDAIWNYFLQILLALQHCHHPNISGTSIGGGHTRSGSGSGAAALGMTPSEADAGGSRRAQILHRDLKPDNVFLDENNTVKLGDFGLSKALAQASFANTYVGTPYYMSPELMQEKAYDSKSDIWSLGCLIYELCALKPPFHEAKTHSELSIFIRNGRIPPLPRGYSQALNAVIRSMLNLNPAMRPSAAQLLQHERLELVFKVAETEKMLSIVKSHRSNLANKECEMLAREHTIAEKERQLSTILQSKEEEITSLQHMVTQLQAHGEALRVALHEAQQKTGYSQQDVDVAIKNAIARREAELRVLVARQEEQVATAMSIREEEIMEAVRQREREVGEAWMKREEELRGEVVKREEEMMRREEELARMEDELARREEDLTKKEEKKAGGRREKGGVFEEVKNTLPSEESSARQFRRATTTGGRGFGTRQPQPQPTPRPLSSFSRGMETPVMRSAPATTDITPIP